MSIRSMNLGFPRIGVQRELKKALESYWAGTSTREALLRTGKELRLRHWQLQRAAGIDSIPCNDFSFYDQMLDMACLLGCVPKRYNWRGALVDLDTYFSMARGSASSCSRRAFRAFPATWAMPKPGRSR